MIEIGKKYKVVRKTGMILCNTSIGGALFFEESNLEAV